VRRSPPPRSRPRRRSPRRRNAFARSCSPPVDGEAAWSAAFLILDQKCGVVHQQLWTSRSSIQNRPPFGIALLFKPRATAIQHRKWAKTSSGLATDYFSRAPRHVGIGDAEAVIIHRLFALLARHVPASNDAACRAPWIRRRFRGGRPCGAESHCRAEHGECQDCLDVGFERHDTMFFP
jgi:hypothetical protein